MAELGGQKQEKEENPILGARPPVTDPITYLTIVEYNLTEENLPILHQALQDPELTANIGWDLIHLLLPLLPASEECLQDIATKGNPRECVLKVTEALRLLEFQDLHEETDEEGHEDVEEGGANLKVPDVEVGESSTSPAFSRTVLPPLSVLKFEILLDLLATLHRRVKTKLPSRFLSTSLQAVLLAFNRANMHQEELTLAAIKLVKTLSGTKRPHLPSRRSSGNLLSRTNTNEAHADPEAQDEAPNADESTLVNRLLQSFITHILEDYVLSLTSDDDVPGLSWASRLMEKYEPRRIPNKPNYQKYADRFAEDEDLRSRTAILGQVVALAQDLGLKTEELVSTILDPEIEKRGIPGTEDEPPATAADIPLSRTGALILYTARNVKQELYAAAHGDERTSLPIFPDHATILQNFVGALGPQTVGLEPEALLDIILALGLVALDNNNIGEPQDDESFAQYLQTVSLISANTPSPSLRGHAHYLTTTTLRSHPHDLVRLTFIRDTLEHCPYENLKASAVSWLKGETLEANDPRANTDDDTPTSIFATPVALQTVAPYLWPDISGHYASKSVDIGDSWMQFRQELGFYVAALNFYYLLLQAQHLHEPLGVKSLDVTHYIETLKKVAASFQKELVEGGELSAVVEEGEAKEQALADVGLLQKVIEWVEGGQKKM
ncbi:YAP-binding/ALF4/Glomulin [Boeremia exigua]|uniref:YAP-binding/ALF4/Glomulin n=1 Tax=Boeremia exigua TaxID=749465 RepID=UPI001E8D268E|nr:YAP-binding/ALF4/Glomulin [Boeremia exigua]KAH6625287.1 YAP-binding/ALF4/Glomulin [Boeremia exigua]